MTDEDETLPEDIPLDSEDTKIFTAYEPNFNRVFARGSLVQVPDDDPDTVQVGFWTDRDENIELEDGDTGSGYKLEAEAVMTWRTARRLRDLLDMNIKEHAPDEFQETGPVED